MTPRSATCCWGARELYGGSHRP
ncbi:hypothetical protein Ahy_A03g010916 isoform C [Arachis hypogaea]|uniref:Uncharacterized protein n=1 Tax=Arachis hypogaea TaxID=3818 RepID=A0A445DNY6_ARAHY|nr:hypothetical protein Ahy_A03g010916 isoform C [Arachis hypogaea]